MTNTLRARIYARSSVGNGASLDEQVDEGREAISAEGWREVGEPWMESASAYGGKPRDDWRAVLSDIRTGALDVLVLWESSRGSRNVDEWAAFVTLLGTRRTRLHVVNSDRTYRPWRPADRSDLLSDGVDSERESGIKSDRITRAMKSNARRGRHNGAGAYGYRRVLSGTRVKGGRELPVYTLTPDEGGAADIVRRIFREAADGKSLRTIAASLNSDGLPSPHAGRSRRGEPVAGRWSSIVVGNMIRNVAYLGRRVHEHTDPDTGLVVRDEHAGEWPALVAESLFRAAGDAVRERKGGARRPAAVRHFLSGLMVCGACGAPLVTKYDRGVPARYGCSAGKGECPARQSISYADANNYVAVSLALRLSQSDMLSAWSTDPAHVEAARDAVARIEREQATLAADVRAGRVNRLVASADADRLDAELAAARAALASLRTVAPGLSAVATGAYGADPAEGSPRSPRTISA